MVDLIFRHFARAGAFEVGYVSAVYLKLVTASMPRSTHT